MLIKAVRILFTKKYQPVLTKTGKKDNNKNSWNAKKPKTLINQEAVMRRILMVETGVFNRLKDRNIQTGLKFFVLSNVMKSLKRNTKNHVKKEKRDKRTLWKNEN